LCTVQDTAAPRLELGALPPELLAGVIKQLTTRDIGRADCVCHLFHGESGPVEQALRQRAAERGGAVAADLPEGESSWTQALCWSERLCAGPRRVHSVGYAHSAFIDEQGRLLTCGNDNNGRPGLLGHGVDVHKLAVPTVIGSLAHVPIHSVSACMAHTLVLTKAGGVLSFGEGSDGKLGHGNEDDVFEPTPIEALRGTRVLAVTAGCRHSLAVTDTGEVFSFGSGQYGRLGHGDQEISYVPILIEALRGVRVVAASAGEYHSLVLSTAGQVYSFGMGSDGQLGHRDDFANQLLPKLIESQPPFSAVSAGRSHSLALSTAGEVYSFGDGENGQLGHCTIDCLCEPDNIMLSAYSPVHGMRFTAVEAGEEHSFAITDKGELYAWGNGDHGKLGLRDYVTHYEPNLVDALRGERVKTVSAWHNHTICALECGRLFGWGAIYVHGPIGGSPLHGYAPIGGSWTRGCWVCTRARGLE